MDECDHPEAEDEEEEEEEDENGTNERLLWQNKVTLW